MDQKCGNMEWKSSCACSASFRDHNRGGLLASMGTVDVSMTVDTVNILYL